MLDKNLYVGAMFLVLKKAFDTVDHQILLKKLSYFNFSPETIQWFRSYLTNREQCIMVNGVKSSILKNTVGVPQGSILGPLLFSLYINDLPNVCTDFNPQMYADDVFIFTHGNDVKDITLRLMDALHSIQHWLKNAGLLLNTRKTVCMLFSKRPTNINRSNVFLDGEELELVSHFTYLGVTLDSDLSFRKHIKRVRNIVNFNLLNFKQIRPFLTFDTARTYLFCLILSHIDYCFTNWAFASTSVLKPIEQLYYRAIKILDRKPNSYHHCKVLEKHNFLDFENLKVFKNVCFIYKCLHETAPAPVKEIIHKKRTTGPGARSGTRGDLEIVRRRTTFGQNVLSIKGGQV